MFDTARDDDEFTCGHCGLPLMWVSNFHRQDALGDKKQLIFVFVVMPNKISLHFDQFEVHVIDFSADLG